MSMRRAVILLAMVAGIGVAGPAVAVAQQPAPEPPVTNCDPFSCLFVIPVGPFGPFEFVLFPNGLGSPPVLVP